jgi:hypothetical protein
MKRRSATTSFNACRITATVKGAAEIERSNTDVVRPNNEAFREAFFDSIGQTEKNSV